MTDLSAESRALADYRPANKVRFVTAASLFDGHDAAINIMRRILQGMGAEVIHLGHNRSVDEVVTAALQEDVQGIAISSYQGGHVEYFKYMVDLLRQRGGAHVQVFGGGGGVIVPAEIRELQGYGVSRIYSPEDGQRMGLAGMIGEMVMRADQDLSPHAPKTLKAIRGPGARRALAQLITALENGKVPAALKAELQAAAKDIRTPVVGITGTGGAGKSSLTDELIRRLRLDQGDALQIAVISIDPSRRKSGGALLGDRIRMNAIGPWRAATADDDGQRVYMRSLATRDFGSEISQALPDVVAACKVAGFDLIVVETSGIGQGDAAIVPLVDVPMYVMTPEFGAASQLEKIDMLDFAEFVAINKFDRKGAADALRDVRKQVQRNREAWSTPPAELPVFGTIAARFSDDGLTALYQHLSQRLEAHGLPPAGGRLAPVATRVSSAVASPSVSSTSRELVPSITRADARHFFGPYTRIHVSPSGSSLNTSCPEFGVRFSSSRNTPVGRIENTRVSAPESGARSGVTTFTRTVPFFSCDTGAVAAAAFGSHRGRRSRSCAVNATSCGPAIALRLNSPPRPAPPPDVASRASSGMLPASCSLRITSSRVRASISPSIGSPEAVTAL